MLVGMVLWEKVRRKRSQALIPSLCGILVYNDEVSVSVSVSVSVYLFCHLHILHVIQNKIRQGDTKKSSAYRHVPPVKKKIHITRDL